MEEAGRDATISLGTVERRTCARLAVGSLIFVRLGNENGGIAFNISEGGLALSAANGLPDAELPELSVQLPESGDWIRTAGQITWRSNSNKEGGVRFVGMAEDDRLRIRQWIASEALSAGSTAERENQDLLKNTELWSPTPALVNVIAAPEREDKDASSSGALHEPEGPSAPKEAPPEDSASDRGDATVFPKVKDDVAAHSRVPGVPVNPYYAEAVLDRRVHPRKPIIPLGYVQLGNKNGGIALNVSEGGLSVTAANELAEDDLPSIRLQFPENGRWVDVKGEVVWRSETRKEAGIRFVDLTELARLQLRNWMAAPVPFNAVEAERQMIGREKERLPPLSAEVLSTGCVTNSSPTEKAPEKDPESSSPPFVVKVLSEVASQPTAHPRVEGAGCRQPVNRPPRGIRVRIKRGRSWKNPGGLFRACTATVAVLVLIGSAWLIREWLSHRAQVSKRIPEVVAPKQTGIEIADVSPPSPRANGAATRQPQPDPVPQGPNNKAELPRGGAIDRIPTAISSDVPERTGGTQLRSEATAAKKNFRGLREPPELNQGNTESSPASVSVPTPSLLAAQPRVVSAPPAPWPDERTRLTTAISPVVSPPKDVTAAKLENSNDPKNVGESPSLPKHVGAAPRINGLVAIATDPYPSIRFSVSTHGKKSPRGTSLRLGQLVSRVEPAYPVEAMQKGVQGTVRIHVIVSAEGSIERLVSVDGPPLLVPATVRAVQQWRYSQTLLAGQPVETEDNIAVTFGLSTGISR